MSVSPTSQSPAAGASTGTAPTNPSAAMNDQSFLALLVAQLRYQDPLSPTDSQSFVQEQAQFSTIEGITNLESSFKSLIASSSFAQAVSLIGKQVSWADADGTTGTGVVSGISNGNGTPELTVGSTDVDPASVVAVTSATTGAAGG